jgi:hypothetical protein
LVHLLARYVVADHYVKDWYANPSREARDYCVCNWLDWKIVGLNTVSLCTVEAWLFIIIYMCTSIYNKYYKSQYWHSLLPYVYWIKSPLNGAWLHSVCLWSFVIWGTPLSYASPDDGLMIWLDVHFCSSVIHVTQEALSQIIGSSLIIAKQCPTL